MSLLSPGGAVPYLSGWTALKFLRGVSGGARKGGSGNHYLVFVDPQGAKYRSMKEVGRALGLDMEARHEPRFPAAACVAPALGTASMKRKWEVAAAEEGTGAVRCCKVNEKDGGAFGCILLAGHEGAHQVEEPPKRARPTFSGVDR